MFLQWFVGREGRKLGSLKRRCGAMWPKEKWKLHAAVARSAFWSQNEQNTWGLDMSCSAGEHFLRAATGASILRMQEGQVQTYSCLRWHLLPLSKSISWWECSETLRTPWRHLLRLMVAVKGPIPFFTWTFRAHWPTHLWKWEPGWLGSPNNEKGACLRGQAWSVSPIQAFGFPFAASLRQARCQNAHVFLPKSLQQRNFCTYLSSCFLRKETAVPLSLAGFFLSEDGFSILC